MRTFVAALLLFSSSVALAESRPEALAPLVFDANALEKAYKKARNRRNLGIALAVPGVASVVLASVLTGYAVNDEPYLFAAGAQAVTGLFLALAGIAVGVPGAVLWVTGQDDMDVVRWRRKQMAAPLVSARPDGGSLGVQLSF